MATQRPHKWSRTHGPPDEWRQRLLAACTARLKKSRHDVHADRRRQRQLVVAEEAARLSGSLDEAALCEFMEQLDAIAAAEDAQFISTAAEDAADVAELVAFQQAVVAPARLLCPVCRTRGLVVAHEQISCECGLTLDNGAGHLSVDMVRQRLEQVTHAHAVRCPAGLTFVVRHEFGTFLWAHCTCGFENIVL